MSHFALTAIERAFGLAKEAIAVAKASAERGVTGGALAEQIDEAEALVDEMETCLADLPQEHPAHLPILLDVTILRCDVGFLRRPLRHASDTRTDASAPPMQ